MFSSFTSSSSAAVSTPPVVSESLLIDKSKLALEVRHAVAVCNANGIIHPSALGEKSSMPLLANASQGGLLGKGKAKGIKGRRGNGVTHRVSLQRHAPMRFPSPRDPFLDNLPYNVIQTLTNATLASNTSGTAYGTSNVLLTLVDQYTQFTGLFDQYRVAMVETSWIPLVDNNNTVALNPGMFATAVDYDDSNNLTSYAQCLDYMNCQETTGFKTHVHTYVPHAAVAAFSGAFTSYMNVTAPWIDATSPSVQHYGTKAAWSVTSSVLTYTIKQRVWLQFRNVR